MLRQQVRIFFLSLFFSSLFLSVNNNFNVFFLFLRVALDPKEVMRFGRLVKMWRKTKATLKNRILVYNSSEGRFLDEVQEDFNKVTAQLSLILQPCFDKALITANLLAQKQVVLILDRLLFEFPLEGTYPLPPTPLYLPTHPFAKTNPAFLSRVPSMLEKCNYFIFKPIQN